ncbi:hypothetical protein FACS189490_09330 [Clostridia bacterium]|nr:hypothetical protein FACS189490_09330 [Clostridia bacterium]
MTAVKATDGATTAIYSRVASADDFAIELQEQIILDYADRNGYGRCACYRDNGKSGLNTNREGLQSLLSDVKSGAVKVAIVRDLSRLSRDYCQLDELVTLLTANDVLLISVADGGVVNDAE